MKFEFQNHRTGETWVIEGNPYQIDAQLRMRFPAAMQDVPQGDIDTGIAAVSRIQHYFVHAVEGYEPPTAPSFAIEYDQPDQEMQPEVPRDDFAKSLQEWLYTDSLAKMAIKDIQPGKPLLTQAAQGGNDKYDYSHVLSPEQRAKGYAIHVYTRGIGTKLLRARLMHTGEDGTLTEAGEVEGRNFADYNPQAMTVDYADVQPEHKGHGLGRAMYEALYAHAHHNGITHVQGGKHSTLAHRAHAALAAKHGMDYQAEPTVGERGYPGLSADWGDRRAFDNAFGPYRYEIKDEIDPAEDPFEKSEDDLAKMAIKEIPQGKFLRGDGATGDELWDYSHVLAPEQRERGYRITVKVRHRPSLRSIPAEKYMRAHLYHEGTLAGELEGKIHGKRKGLSVEYAEVQPMHRGKGLGRPLYEALYAHAHNRHGTTYVYGDVHSTLAHNAHSALAAKHGMKYESKFVGDPNDTRGPFDGAYGKYRYTIKDEINPSEDPFEKAEKTAQHNLENEIAVNTDLVQDMLGFSPHAHSAFDTARLMAGGPLLSLDQIRRALYEEDGDIERASLRAYGIEPNERTLKTLRDLAKVAMLGKSEGQISQHVVAPGNPEADDAAAAIGRAFKYRSVQQVSLNGKYSKGSMVAKDPQTQKIYLLKPSSDGNSPAKGVKEERASQPRREAAFSHIAYSFGLGDDVARADLILIDGNEWAAIELLPFNYKALEKRWKMDRADIYKLLERYRQRGTLHKWAILDYVLGNPDRHGQNMMVGGDVDHPANERIALIDHGSAFAGNDFDPAYDKNSFVPFYLRYLQPDKFNSLSVKDKLRYMPKLPQEQENALNEWFDHLTADKLRSQLEYFGIDPRPALVRLAKLHIVSGPLDEVVNKAWVGT